MWLTVALPTFSSSNLPPTNEVWVRLQHLTLKNLCSLQILQETRLFLVSSVDIHLGRHRKAGGVQVVRMLSIGSESQFTHR